ncbi:hypothetical protein CU633_01070 [Bacillus sp. V3-13]|nr:hypothetical protein CU633_01070 [Bacillus sp. V3-13]
MLKFFGQIRQSCAYEWLCHKQWDSAGGWIPLLYSIKSDVVVEESHLKAHATRIKKAYNTQNRENGYSGAGKSVVAIANT